MVQDRTVAIAWVIGEQKTVNANTSNKLYLKIVNNFLKIIAQNFPVQ